MTSYLLLQIQLNESETSNKGKTGNRSITLYMNPVDKGLLYVKAAEKGRFNTYSHSAVFLSLYHCMPFELLNNEE